ncbi:ATP-binding protein [Caenispirillum salinarum]|uniref:ATP-binding protein n=1 Tax=Caenispirillum salinarum TaxID=859058 RepID=UPI00384B60A3
MVAPWLIVIASLMYVGLLFAIAWWGDRRAEQGRSVIRNPMVYTLSIAVYCTSWTFYGAVGTAARKGPEFLTIYLGPTLMFLAWWFVLRKIVRITRTHRVTSIADFISSRYGKSPRLSGLVTVIAMVGTMPYIALQLKAVATSYTALVGFHAIVGAPSPPPAAVPADTAFWVAVAMAVFAILFGTRHIDASEHHEGVVAAIAFESLVKLLAFLAVGLFVVFIMHDGFADLFALAAERVPDAAQLYALSGATATDRWVTMLLLAMVAVICLPRQFQVTAVENVDERHVSTAAWAFPLYLAVISLFVLPIAVAGLIHLPSGAEADSFVLTVPLSQGNQVLALIAFLGGLSSATGMVIVAAISLSIMISNDLVMPLLLRLKWLRLTSRGDLTGLLLFIRRASIVALLLMGYGYYRATGGTGALASIGLISFSATAQLAPAMLGGLFWKNATRAGAHAGLLAGFAMWAYTLVLPSMASADWIGPEVVQAGPWGIALLRPEALFGLEGLDPLAHALFWSWLFNIGAFVGVSVFGKQGPLERVQATVFVDIFRRRDTATPHMWRRAATVKDLYALTQRFLGHTVAYRLFRQHAKRMGARSIRSLTDADPALVTAVEQELAGSIGAASARVMVASVAKGDMVSLNEVLKILEETSQVIEYSQRLEQKSRELERTTAELREANRRLQELDRLKDEFLSTVSHELRTPLTSIRSFSEILTDNPDLTREEVERFLGIIMRESERLTRLIDQLLDLARLQAGHGDWNMAPVSVREALEHACGVVNALYTERRIGLSLEIKGDTEVAPVHADRDRLTQVFVNLLSNAAKYAPPQSGQVAVKAECGRDDWRVSVADNGPGIPPDRREQVFDRFVQVPEAEGGRPGGGTGLGLAISRQIIEHFGGHIWVEASPQGGALFRLILPRSGMEPRQSEPGQAAQ